MLIMQKTYKAVPSSITASWAVPDADPNISSEEFDKLSATDQYWFMQLDCANELTMKHIFEKFYNDRHYLDSFLLNPNIPEDIRSIIQQRVDELDVEAKERYDRAYNDARVESTKWPDPERFNQIYDDEDMEDIWSTYLSGPEDEVQKELQIFCEPSTQGGVGGMFIFDESGEERFETVEVDFSEWESNELDIASSSNSPEEYKQKFKAYVESLIY